MVVIVGEVFVLFLGGADFFDFFLYLLLDIWVGCKENEGSFDGISRILT